MKSLKRILAGLIGGQAIYMYRQDSNWKKQFNQAKGLNKLKVLRDGIRGFNKNLAEGSKAGDIMQKVEDKASELYHKAQTEYKDEISWIETEYNKLMDKREEVQNNPEYKKTISDLQTKAEDMQSQLKAKIHELDAEYDLQNKLTVIQNKLKDMRDKLTADSDIPSDKKTTSKTHSNKK